jgi:hypothetical protein
MRRDDALSRGSKNRSSAPVNWFATMTVNRLRSGVTRITYSLRCSKRTGHQGVNDRCAFNYRCCTRWPMGLDPALAVSLRLGEEVAAELAGIPDSEALRTAVEALTRSDLDDCS